MTTLLAYRLLGLREGGGSRAGCAQLCGLSVGRERLQGLRADASSLLGGRGGLDCGVHLRAAVDHQADHDEQGDHHDDGELGDLTALELLADPAHDRSR